MIVTIDGPAGSGKSTVAKLLAQKEGFLPLDSGAMYRALTLACLRAGVDVRNAEAVTALLSRVKLRYEPAPDGARVYLNDEEVSNDIRSDAIDEAVSSVAAIPDVRDVMVALQRQVAFGQDIVAEGRDMGTVVFPAAEIKIYLDASPAARARRRSAEKIKDESDQVRDSKIKDSKKEREFEAVVEDELLARDAKDATRTVAPLVKASDAILIDSSSLSIEEVVALIDTRVQEAKAKAYSSKSIASTTPNPPREASLSSNSKDPNATVPSTDVPNASNESSAPRPRQKTFKPGPKAHPRPQTSYDARLKPMRAFSNNFEDYFDHALMNYPLPSRVLYDLIGVGVVVITKLLWPWRFEGESEFFDWLETQDRGTVLIMNHVSLVETALPSVLYWLHGQRIRPIYKAEINQNPMGAWLLSRVGGIPVSRGTSDLKALRRAQHALERGESVLVFPEGTRIKTTEQEVERHGGFALIARMGKTTVTPSAVAGLARKAQSNPFARRRAFLAIGEPITFGMLGVKGRRAQLEAMEKKAMDKVYELRARLRLEHPGEI